MLRDKRRRQRDKEEREKVNTHTHTHGQRHGDESAESQGNTTVAKNKRSTAGRRGRNLSRLHRTKEAAVHLHLQRPRQREEKTPL